MILIVCFLALIEFLIIIATANGPKTLRLMAASRTSRCALLETLLKIIVSIHSFI